MTTPYEKIARRVSLAALAVLLGGCQMLGIGGGKLARASDDRALAGQSIDLGGEQLAAGREALAAGRTADAIDSFMLAKAFPQHMPAAYNGLAVAYSRLGRTDLTERFFLTAVALAPEEDRYRANLALFYTRNGQPKLAEPALAIAPLEPPAAEQAPPVAIAAAAAPAPVVRSLGGGVTVRSPGTHLQRVSRGEVAIRSGGATAPVVKTAAPARRAVIEVGGARAQDYPVRVTLADPKPAEARRPAYPIRIPLSD